MDTAAPSPPRSWLAVALVTLAAVVLIVIGTVLFGPSTQPAGAIGTQPVETHEFAEIIDALVVERD